MIFGAIPFVPLVIIIQLFFGLSKLLALQRLPKDIVIVLAFTRGLSRTVMWFICLYFSCYHEIHMFASGPHLVSSGHVQ